MAPPATASRNRAVDGDWPGAASEGCEVPCPIPSIPSGCLPAALPPSWGSQKFALGQLVATPGALRAMLEAGQSPAEFLRRHAAGDWGDLESEDRLANDRALVEETRVFSAYRTAIGTKLWVLTEWDRSVTTILLPDEY